MAAITSFIFSVMAAMDVKTPTWDGEGIETTLVTSVVCSLLQVMLLIPSVVSWQRMVWQYDAQCRARLSIDNFACIASASSHTLAIADIPLAFGTYLLWRLSHAYDVCCCRCDSEADHELLHALLLTRYVFEQAQVARKNGQIADSFTLAAKTGASTVRRCTHPHARCLPLRCVL